MRQIKAIIQPFMLEKVLHALAALDELPGVTVSDVVGWGRSRAVDAEHTVRQAGHAFAKKKKVEIVVPASLAPRVTEALSQAARTGRPGDGKVFESEVSEVMRIRTGETGTAAI